MQRYELTPTLPSLAGRVFYVYANNLAEALTKFKHKFGKPYLTTKCKLVDQPSFDIGEIVDNRVAPGS